MDATYRLSANELTMDFLKSLKTLYKDQKIAITIEVEQDETEYLLSSEANSKMLEKSLKEAEKGNLISINIDDLP
ncbi:MAG: hypothetical protein FVQ77_14310 [Cytophagales bacterium]|nr:hypothetical protein [Cytophagales bacterium]